jgi:hypothetical protein
MKVRWEDLDLTAWDAAHAAAAASLQQDSAYGVAMQKIGVPVLRAQVEVEGKTVAYAQFIVRRFGRLGAVALCTRGPIWLTPLSPKEEAAVYAALKKTIPLQGLRFVLFTPEIPQGQPQGLYPWRRVMTGMSTVMIDLTPSMEDLRAQLDRRWRHRLVGGEASEMTIHRVGTNPGQRCNSVVTKVLKVYRWTSSSTMLRHDPTQLKLYSLCVLTWDVIVSQR